MTFPDLHEGDEETMRTTLDRRTSGVVEPEGEYDPESPFRPNGNGEATV